jgi:O-antigen/teichoic acid export membrane protein
VFIISNLAVTYFSALYYARKWFLSINIIVFIANVIVLAGLLYRYITYGNGEDKLLPLLTSEISGQKSVSLSSIGDFVNTESYYYGAMVFFGGLLLQAFILMIFYFLSAGFSVTQVAYNPRIIRNIFLYSSVAFISNILFFLVTRVDYYFVQKYCGEIVLSNYVQVSKMGQILILLPTMIASVLFPYSSDMKEEGNLNRLQLLCKILSLLFIPATFLIIVFGYWGFPWLFGPGFVLMYRAMLLYLPGFYFLNILTLLAAYLAGKAMLTKNLAASVIALVVVVIGDVLLIPVWGINAAAAISSVAYFLCMVYLLWIFKHEIGCKVQNFFIVNKKDRQLLISKLLK